MSTGREVSAGNGADMSECESVINRYFGAMRRGAEAESDMMSLFADNAVYEEPFSGIGEPARGKREIRDRLKRGWEQPLPEVELEVLSIEVNGQCATSRWECRSTAFPAPVRGTDHYEFTDGLIALLRVTLGD